MKNTLLLLLLFVGIHISNAQTPYLSYDYDASGNRIQRTVIMKKSMNAIGLNGSTTPIEQKVETDLFNKLKVTIYPNPTKGELGVDITGDIEMPESSLNLYTLNGQLLIKKEHLMKQNRLDLSRFISGIYFLKLIVGNDVMTWKIVKE
jgi:YD repeat-containing protein